MLTLSFLEILYAAVTDRTSPIAKTNDTNEDMVVERMNDIVFTTSASSTKDSTPGERGGSKESWLLASSHHSPYIQLAHHPHTHISKSTS